MKDLSSHKSVRPSEEARMDGEHDAGQVGVVGNERLTALAGVVLLVLLLSELASAVSLRAGMTLHIVAGLLLCGPLVVKLGSTGYRFLRYYTRSHAYVHKGSPSVPKRVLAPLLVVATLAVVGSGIGLVVAGPVQAGPLRPLHDLSVLVWLSLIAIHICAYLLRTPRLVADDWRKPPDRGFLTGGEIRLGVNLGALLAGAGAAIILFPGIAPWVAWSQASQRISSPLIIGLGIAALVLLIARPLRWK